MYYAQYNTEKHLKSTKKDKYGQKCFNQLSSAGGTWKLVKIHSKCVWCKSVDRNYERWYCFMLVNAWKTVTLIQTKKCTIFLYAFLSVFFKLLSLISICFSHFDSSLLLVCNKAKNKINNQLYPCRGWQRMVYFWIKVVKKGFLRYCLIFN